MPLDVVVGLGPGHVVLDGGPSSPTLKRGTNPQFWTMSVVAGWIRIALGKEVGLRPGNIVLDGTQLLPR